MPLLLSAVELPGMTFIWAALVALVGLLMYVLASNAKLAEIGRIMFFCGLLAVLLAVR